MNTLPFFVLICILSFSCAKTFFLVTGPAPAEICADPGGGAWLDYLEVTGPPDGISTNYTQTNPSWTPIRIANYSSLPPVDPSTTLISVIFSVRRRGYPSPAVECKDSIVKIFDDGGAVEPTNYADAGYVWPSSYENYIFNLTNVAYLDPSVFTNPELAIDFKTKCYDSGSNPAPYALIDAVELSVFHSIDTSIVSAPGSMFPGELINISLGYVASDLSYYCKIGTTVLSMATRSDGTSVSCPSYPALSFGLQSVEFGYDGTEWTDNGFTITVTQPSVSAISPNLISDNSTLYDINVTGSDFNPGLFCIWENRANPGSVYALSANVTNSTFLSCLLDPLVFLSFFGENSQIGSSYNFSVAYDPIQYDDMLNVSTPLLFIIDPYTPIDSFAPKIVQASGGGTLYLTLPTNPSFLDTFHFDFGNGSFGIINETLFNYDDQTDEFSIELPAAPQSEFATRIRYTLDDGYSWSDYSTSLLYFISPNITGYSNPIPLAYMNRLPSTSGAQAQDITINNTITGNGFFVLPGYESALICGLSNSSDAFLPLSVAIFINSTTVICPWSTNTSYPDSGSFNLSLSFSDIYPPQPQSQHIRNDNITNAEIEIYVPEVVSISVPNSVEESYSDSLSVVGNFHLGTNVTCGIGTSFANITFVLPGSVSSPTAISCTCSGGLPPGAFYMFISSNEYNYFGGVNFNIHGTASNLIFLNTSAVAKSGNPESLADVLTTNISSAQVTEKVPQIAVVDLLMIPVGSFSFTIDARISGYTPQSISNSFATSPLLNYMSNNSLNPVQVTGLGLLNTDINHIGQTSPFSLIGPSGAVVDLILGADGQGLDFGTYFSSFYNASMTILPCSPPLVDSAQLNAQNFSNLLSQYENDNPFDPYKLVGCVCPPGYSTHFISPYLRSCSLCSSNSFSDSYDTATCILCPSNQGLISATSTRCECTPGLYTDPEDSAKCLFCPEHANCPGGSIIVPNDGYWADPDNPSSLYECFNPDHCVEGKCLDTHTGPLCSLCDEGYNGRVGSTCSPCPDSIVWGVIILIVLAILFAMTIIRILATLSAGFPSTTIVARITLTFLQIAFLIGRVPTNWPQALTGFFTFASFAFGNIISYSCAWDITIYDQFLVSLISPLIIIVIITIYLVIQFKIAINGLSQSDMELSNIGYTALRATIIAYSLVVLYLFHPAITLYSFSIFNCTDINGISYITYSMRLQCSGPEYTGYVVLSLITILVYVIGFPAIALRIMYKNRFNLQNLETQFVLRFFYYGYRRHQLDYGTPFHSALRGSSIDGYKSTNPSHVPYQASFDISGLNGSSEDQLTDVSLREFGPSSSDGVKHYNQLRTDPTELTEHSQYSNDSDLSKPSKGSKSKKPALETVHVLSFIKALKSGANESGESASASIIEKARELKYQELLFKTHTQTEGYISPLTSPRTSRSQRSHRSGGTSHKSSKSWETKKTSKSLENKSTRSTSSLERYKLRSQPSALLKNPTPTIGRHRKSISLTNLPRTMPLDDSSSNSSQDTEFLNPPDEQNRSGDVATSLKISGSNCETDTSTSSNTTRILTLCESESDTSLAIAATSTGKDDTSPVSGAVSSETSPEIKNDAETSATETETTPTKSTPSTIPSPIKPKSSLSKASTMARSSITLNSSGSKQSGRSNKLVRTKPQRYSIHSTQIDRDNLGLAKRTPSTPPAVSPNPVPRGGKLHHTPSFSSASQSNVSARTPMHRVRHLPNTSTTLLQSPNNTSFVDIKNTIYPGGPVASSSTTQLVPHTLYSDSGPGMDRPEDMESDDEELVPGASDPLRVSFDINRVDQYVHSAEDNSNDDSEKVYIPLRNRVRNFIKSLQLSFYYEFVILFRKTLIVAVYSLSIDPFISFWAILWIMYISSLILIDSDPYEEKRYVAVEAMGIFGHFLLAAAGLLFINIPVPNPFAVLVTVLALTHHICYIVYLFYLFLGEISFAKFKEQLNKLLLGVIPKANTASGVQDAPSPSSNGSPDPPSSRDDNI